MAPTWAPASVNFAGGQDPPVMVTTSIGRTVARSICSWTAAKVMISQLTGAGKEGVHADYKPACPRAFRGCERPRVGCAWNVTCARIAANFDAHGLAKCPQIARAGSDEAEHDQHRRARQL